MMKVKFSEMFANVIIFNSALFYLLKYEIC